MRLEYDKSGVSLFTNSEPLNNDLFSAYQIHYFLSGSGVSQQQILDVYYDKYSTSTYWNSLGFESKIAAQFSADGNVSIDNVGNVSRLSDNGIGNIYACIKDKKLKYTIDTSTKSVASSSYLFSGFHPQSLCYNMTQEIDSRISGVSASTAIDIFSSSNYLTNTFSYNTGFWAHDIKNDFTCIAVGNSETRNRQKCGVLITKKHLVIVNHWSYPIGTKVKFVNSDSEIEEFTVIDYIRDANAITFYQAYGTYSLYYEFLVCLLDREVSDKIYPAKIFPNVEGTKFFNESCSDQTGDISNPEQYYRQRGQPPVFFVNQFGKASVRNLSTIFTKSDNINGLVSNFSCLSPLREEANGGTNREDFYIDAIGGDSGAPTFAIINGEIVLLGLLTWGGWGFGNFLGVYKDSINSSIQTINSRNSVAGDYSVTEADVSMFNTY